jgi:hypothetical protein
MNENTERIERYLQGIVPPEHESEPHRQQLRRQILGEIERRHSMSVRGRAWKIAAAVAALVCTGAVATTIGVKFYFEGVDEDGRYHFTTGPQTVYERTYQDANGVQYSVVVATKRGVTMGPDDAGGGASVEQMQSDLEEIEALRQRDERELVGVRDQEMNGRPFRVFTFKYVLADGRTRTMNEGAPEQDKPQTAAQIEQDQEEVARLRAQGVRDVVKVIDTGVEGRIHRTLICRYVLADGRDMTMGEGAPDWPPPADGPTGEQVEEIWRLKELGQGESLEKTDQSLYGKTFTFESYRFTLADGTAATLSLGEVKGRKANLTDADWKEFRDLLQANAGELLGTYEEEVRGKVFVFERKRYTLSDGTEIIRAEGVPKVSQ